MSGLRLDPIPDALAALAAGRPVVVVDDEDRENEGDLILAASAATQESIAFAVRHSSGLLCAPMSAERADALELPLMVADSTDPLRTAYTISVDAREGVTTGISAADRARSLRLLADPETAPTDLARPGHVLPLRARPGGVLERRGHTEAAVDLTRLAGLEAVGMIVELVHDDGTMQRGPALREFADRHGLVLISIEDLAVHRLATGDLALDVTAPVTLPTDHGTFEALAVREPGRGGGADAEHLVLVRGDVTSDEPVLTRVHSECLTGDVLGSHRCDCGPQLHESLDRIDRAGRGVLVLLRGHEGRGIGLADKLRAYALQDAGRDTVEANLDLGLPVDARSYGIVPRILAHLGVHSIDLLSHNPDKARELTAGGVEVRRVVDLDTHPTAQNLAYLTTKRDRLGHHLLGLPEPVLTRPTPTSTTPSSTAPTNGVPA
ncbi:3,4-dihydroxy-2-butanone-4-phosphate synthase [Brachybacterium aquaticum]|uniref:Multifunctional fusion protein n=1 Tax=Brachybacterium aquaticum TaxID=1432564 RepID=A0A841AIW7_9MICO|nr:3,4-dihydroxy-2-butanone-4-phosphate synthase [Brachybacterium aquaticum]MBB5832964.1 3,4-dihydroxy 2-butanone 4-phosphate synthase/GTP cyclohydrolase II [Brachybacterium aquaticum]